jgi:hypothetical protein
MVIKINGLSFEEWESQVQGIMQSLRIDKKPIQPFDYWQGSYTPILAVMDMFPQEFESKESACA